MPGVGPNLAPHLDWFYRYMAERVKLEPLEPYRKHAQNNIIWDEAVYHLDNPLDKLKDKKLEDYL